MEVQTIQKHIHTSFRKLQLVADMVRKMKPTEALTVLEFTPQAASLPLSKAIKTALANGKQQGIEPEKLNFKKLEIGQGMDMKRVRYGGRGHRRMYAKRTSHIKIVLTDEVKKEKNGTKN